MTTRFTLVLMALLGGGAPALSAQSGLRVDIMAHGVLAATRAEHTPLLSPVTEVRVVQPMVMAEVAALGDRLRFTATLNFEGVTIGEGELSPGAWGEGFVDRRHPHTTVHELILAGVDLLGTRDGVGRIGVVVGKGFAPFGTDDPMSRPSLKYPVNHHFSQVLERAIAMLQYEYGPVTAEAALFNGDEPERPGQWPLLRRSDGQRRFGDSWSARLTVRPTAAIELQGSFADVHSPEHRDGAGGDAKKYSASARWADAPSWGSRYALVEWARTSELEGFFRFHSVLAETEVRRGVLSAAYRFERTERPEEERLGDPFRSRRPHLENSILGITRWTLHTVRAGWDVVPPGQRLRVSPFVEATVGRVATVGGGVFDVIATYGSNRVAAVSVGVTVGWRDRGHRMGRYGVLAMNHDSITHDHEH